MKYVVALFFSFTFFLFAQDEAPQENKSSHQREWEFYNAHPELANQHLEKPAIAKRPRSFKTESLNKIVYGFHPYWQNGLQTNYQWNLLTHLVYFSADIDTATGGFSSTHNWGAAAGASVVNAAKANGVKVHLALVLFGGHSAILNNQTKKNNLIQNTLTQLALRNADGLNVDFEGVSATNKDSFRVFMKQLGDSLKAHGYEFVIELPAVDWNGVFTSTFFTALNSVTDFYFAMLYDYYWSTSTTAGPVSPLLASNNISIRHVLRSVDYYLGVNCPAGKFLAGFPNYGYDWPVESSTRMAAATGSATSRTWSSIKNNYIDTIPLANQFVDATYNVPWYRYHNGTTWRQTWYDDSLSWSKKFDSIKIKNVGGTGMWALGNDGSEPELWGAIASAFGVGIVFNTGFDNFENGVGRFDKAPTYSGSTVGISKSSTSAQSSEQAFGGTKSLKVVLKDSAAVSTDWSVRLLSGTGNRTNNYQFSNSGYFGFWMKTSSAPSGAQVAVTIDDQRTGITDKTELSAKINVINDGEWHLYQWKIPGAGWTSFAGGNGVLDSAILSLDAIMLYAPDASPDWTLYIDSVSWNSSGTLPVELTEFNIEYRTPNVELQWMTATEVNNYGFEVEKKLQDSKIPKFQDWVKVGFVEGAGNSNSPKNYLFTDNNITDGKITYRLKQIDRDGNFTYSHEVEIEAGNIPQRFSLEQNYPNPFNPTTQIRFTIPVSSFTTLKVYDIVGREVAMLVNEVKEAGSYSVQLSMNEYQLSSGVYFYTLRAGNFVATKKMLLMK